MFRLNFSKVIRSSNILKRNSLNINNHKKFATLSFNSSSSSSSSSSSTYFNTASLALASCILLPFLASQSNCEEFSSELTPLEIKIKNEEVNWNNFCIELIQIFSTDQLKFNSLPFDTTSSSIYNVDSEECKQRGKPWNSYHSSLHYPDCLISPSTTEEISKLLSLCNKYKIAVVPYAGGTSLEGQLLSLIPSRRNKLILYDKEINTNSKSSSITSSSYLGVISIDFTLMNQVLSFRPDDLDITVQPGLTYIDLNNYLQNTQTSSNPLQDPSLSTSYWFPLDPGPGACVGGMAACRCSGSTAVRYGTMRENTLALTVVLPDGKIIYSAGQGQIKKKENHECSNCTKKQEKEKNLFNWEEREAGGRARKSSAGYDLTRLMVGSEGTLGIVTEATLKIHPLPKYLRAIRLTFDGKGNKERLDKDSSSLAVVDATEVSRKLINLGIPVIRCELLDDEMVRVINSVDYGKDSPSSKEENYDVIDIHSKWPEYTTLLIELGGISEEEIQEHQKLVEKIAKINNVHSISICNEKKDRDELWKKRKEALWTAMALYSNDLDETKDTKNKNLVKNTNKIFIDDNIKEVNKKINLKNTFLLENNLYNVNSKSIHLDNDKINEHYSELVQLYSEKLYLTVKSLQQENIIESKLVQKLREMNKKKDLMITDVCVPLSNLPVILSETKKIMNQINSSSSNPNLLPAPIVAHAGDGNFHSFIFFSTNKLKKYQEIIEEHTLLNSLESFFIQLLRKNDDLSKKVIKNLKRDFYYNYSEEKYLFYLDVINNDMYSEDSTCLLFDKEELDRINFLLNYLSKEEKIIKEELINKYFINNIIQNQDVQLVYDLNTNKNDVNFSEYLTSLGFNSSDSSEELAKKLSQYLVYRAISLGGTCTGEHGVGVGKKSYLPIELGEENLNMMRNIKGIFDTNGILNPGKILDYIPTN